MKKVQRQHDQRGIVSLFVTLVMMVVISLIILGLGQVARSNQSNALDRQLSSQAFYAAESGINDVFSIIKQPSHNSAASDFTSCNNFLNNNGYSGRSNLSSTYNVAYTCVLVNEHPTSLQLSRVVTGQSRALPLHPSGSLKTLLISWKATAATSDTGASCGTLSALPPVTSTPPDPKWNCDYGLLRMDLTRTPANPTAQSLDSSTAALYIKPALGSYPATATAVNLFNAPPTEQAQTQIIAAGCDDGACQALLGLPGGSNYFARFSGIYRDIVELHVDGTDALGNDLRFNDAQVVVDSTGKAQNVLRRIRERLNISGNSASDVPSNAVESQTTFCKYFQVGIPSPESNLCKS